MYYLDSLEKFKSRFRDKTALVIGLGKFGGGLGAIKFLQSICKKVFVADTKTPDEFKDIIQELSGLQNLEFKFGIHKREDFENKDLIILNPSVMTHSEIFNWARDANVPIFTEISLFFSLCKGKKIGITGTLGKSTTASVIYTILKNAGIKCWLGGNIGGSLLPNLENIKQTDWVILELSSFQLQYFPFQNLAADISIITNIHPDHLDKHQNFKQYLDAKINMVRFQIKNNFCILNFDDLNVKKFSDYTDADVYYFSKINDVNRGTFLKKDDIYFSDSSGLEKIFSTIELKNTLLHIDTILAASVCAKLLKVSNEKILSGINSFKNLEHRLEVIAQYEGRTFINDSNATTPQASIFGLELIKTPKIVISGGKNKNIDYEPICKLLANQAKAIFLIGETASLFEKMIKNYNSNANIFKSANLKEATLNAYKVSEKGDCIILSPATSSFDQFSNFVERGNNFKTVIKEIING